MNKYGEKYAGDTKFVADCRELQSIYRVEIGEEIRPYVGRDGKQHYYGNYIDGGKDSGANFLTPCAFEYAKYRVRHRKPNETIHEDRLFNNLLSSQPMAFNLFCPLRKIREEAPDVATRVIQSALPMYPIQEVTDIDLEFIPEKYKELTGDKSAMDAIIRFVDTTGKKSFIAIETKYSENLGTNEPSKKEKAVEVINKLKCFSPNAKLTQIYRNFLLSEAYANKEGLESYSIILAPERHPLTKTEVASFVQELAPEYKHKPREITLEDFVGKLIETCPNEYKQAFADFFDRYLNFSKLSNVLNRAKPNE